MVERVGVGHHGYCLNAVDGEIQSLVVQAQTVYVGVASGSVCGFELTGGIDADGVDGVPSAIVRSLEYHGFTPGTFDFAVDGPLVFVGA